MSHLKRAVLSATEEELRARFDKTKNLTMNDSTAKAVAPDRRLDMLILRNEEKGEMPFTKDKYVISEDPHLVRWEREVRLFLRQLTPNSGHRVSAVMVYEWATGIRVADMIKLKVRPEYPGQKTWRSDLRQINKLLTYYFGKPAMTKIMGRKVSAYTVRHGYYIRRHRPMTLLLYAEYVEGALYP